MNRQQTKLIKTLAAMVMVVVAPMLSGCQPSQPFFLHEHGDMSHYMTSATEVSYPDSQAPILPDAEQAMEPLSLENPEFREFWDLTLEEAVSIALQNNKTITTLGQVRTASQVGQSSSSPPETVLLSPDFSTSIYDPAIQESSNQGVEAALAQFDTQFSTSLFWERTDRPQNVEPTLQGEQIFARILQNETSNFQSELSKRSATGTQFFARNITSYEGTNRPLRAVPSDWTTLMELEARHPLLRNAGTQFNRIPVVIARIQTDLAIAQLETAVRNQVLEVERTYWDLYFHYFNLQTAKVGAQSALETWRIIKTLAEGGIERGGAQNLAQVEEQYYAFEGQVQDAQRRLFQSERNLRSLLSIAHTDGRFIRPIDKPVLARVEFAWHTVLDEAMVRSVELRAQNFRIKQRELQVIQARNQVLPQLDLQALYRWVGLGDQLISSDRRGINFPEPNSTAFDNLTEGDFGEWRLGLNFEVPLGVRAELAQVRNTQLLLARERDRLDRLKLEISHGLAATYEKVKSQHRQVTTRLNQRRAAAEQLAAFEIYYETGTPAADGNNPIDQLLDAQRRKAQSEVQYHEAVVSYNQALAELHWRKGSLLELNNILLQEGPWPAKAYYDALLEGRRMGASRPLNYGFNRPKVITQGPFLQHGGQPMETSSSAGGEEGAPLDEEMLRFEDSLDQLESLPPASPEGEIPSPRSTGELPAPLPTVPAIQKGAAAGDAASGDGDDVWGDLELE